jgi:multidrug resistance protein, MATE family
MNLRRPDRGFAWRAGAVGVWIGLALGLAVVAILLLLRWVGKERRGFAV